jgi:hypothetical protein
MVVILHYVNVADFMREPSDIAVAGSEFYVCDFKVFSHFMILVMGYFFRKNNY